MKKENIGSLLIYFLFFLGMTALIFISKFINQNSMFGHNGVILYSDDCVNKFGFILFVTFKCVCTIVTIIAFIVLILMILRIILVKRIKIAYNCAKTIIVFLCIFQGISIVYSGSKQLFETYNDSCVIPYIPKEK